MSRRRSRKAKATLPDPAAPSNAYVRSGPERVVGMIEVRSAKLQRSLLVTMRGRKVIVRPPSASPSAAQQRCESCNSDIPRGTEVQHRGRYWHQRCYVGNGGDQHSGGETVLTRIGMEEDELVFQTDVSPSQVPGKDVADHVAAEAAKYREVCEALRRNAKAKAKALVSQDDLQAIGALEVERIRLEKEKTGIEAKFDYSPSSSSHGYGWHHHTTGPTRPVKFDVPAVKSTFRLASGQWHVLKQDVELTPGLRFSKMQEVLMRWSRIEPVSVETEESTVRLQAQVPFVTVLLEDQPPAHGRGGQDPLKWIRQQQYPHQG